MVMVPVATLQVGCVIVTVGAAGVTGCVFTVPVAATELHVPLLAVMLYAAPAVMELNIGDVCNPPPFRLYEYADPIGEVMVKVPVATLQVGSVTLTTGVAGVAGWTFTVTLLTAEVQLPLFTVRV